MMEKTQLISFVITEHEHLKKQDYVVSQNSKHFIFGPNELWL